MVIGSNVLQEGSREVGQPEIPARDGSGRESVCGGVDPGRGRERESRPGGIGQRRRSARTQGRVRRPRDSGGFPAVSAKV